MSNSVVCMSQPCLSDGSSKSYKTCMNKLFRLLPMRSAMKCVKHGWLDGTHHVEYEIRSLQYRYAFEKKKKMFPWIFVMKKCNRKEICSVSLYFIELIQHKCELTLFLQVHHSSPLSITHQQILNHSPQHTPTDTNHPCRESQGQLAPVAMLSLL